MEWRPDDWKPFEVKEYPLHCLAPEQCTNSVYEAGADAMYKSLNKRFHFTILNEFINCWLSSDEVKNDNK